jgi:hypothetical protein
LEQVQSLDIDNSFKGIGITMAYDSRFERIIVTKLDKMIKQEIISQAGMVQYNPETRDLLINNIPKRIFNKMRKALKDVGYCHKVIKDEIQAYLSSGDCSFFDDYVDWEENQKIGKAFEKHFNKHITLNIKK